jgi:hypothetical protein
MNTTMTITCDGVPPGLQRRKAGAIEIFGPRWDLHPQTCMQGQRLMREVEHHATCDPVDATEDEDDDADFDNLSNGSGDGLTFARRPFGKRQPFARRTTVANPPGRWLSCVGGGWNGPFIEGIPR